MRAFFVGGKGHCHAKAGHRGGRALFSLHQHRIPKAAHTNPVDSKVSMIAATLDIGHGARAGNAFISNCIHDTSVSDTGLVLA
nr:hypothetical protein NCPCFENI_01163 [Cupriavidus sp.]